MEYLTLFDNVIQDFITQTKNDYHEFRVYEQNVIQILLLYEINEKQFLILNYFNINENENENKIIFLIKIIINDSNEMLHVKLEKGLKKLIEFNVTNYFILLKNYNHFAFSIANRMVTFLIIF